jgi:hypothetical protein
MAVWPAGLQQRQFSPVKDRAQDGAIRTAMETGAPKSRKRFTAVVRDIDIPIVLNFADRATFDTFYNTTLSFGSTAFDWTDPDDDSTTVSFRFRNPVAWTKRGGEFQGIMNLEIIP